MNTLKHCKQVSLLDSTPTETRDEEITGLRNIKIFQLRPTQQAATLCNMNELLTGNTYLAA